MSHLVSIGSFHSLGLNPCRSRGLTPSAIPSPITASSEHSLSSIWHPQSAFCRHREKNMTFTDEAWADSREGGKHFSHVIIKALFFFLLLAATSLSGEDSLSHMLVLHMYHFSSEEAFTVTPSLVNSCSIITLI